MAHRTSGSILGVAESPCKGGDGKILMFETSGAAESYRKELTDKCQSGNVFYSVEPYEA